jgi:hypothetical protein
MLRCCRLESAGMQGKLWGTYGSLVRVHAVLLNSLLML